MSPHSKNAKTTARGRGQWQGMNWIRQEKRLAIYLRDGLACVYCGATIKDGAQFTLDHVIVFSKGGQNTTANLVTACSRCNSGRGARSIKVWAKVVAAYMGIASAEVLSHVAKCTARAIDVNEAKRLIALHGSAAKVMEMAR